MKCDRGCHTLGQLRHGLHGGGAAVELIRPPDGNYQIWAQGWAVTGTQPFPLSITALQGTDLTVTGLPTGPITAGTPVTLHGAFAKTMAAGQDYFGELLLGPPTAPTAFKVPITIRRG
jgi:hypothetical protein